MFSKIIFVLATVCVVSASVISVNVFDDDPETEVASNPKDCNFEACDQLCRRLKFPGGACVNGRCKCDNFLNAEDGVSEKTLSGLLQTEDSEAKVAAIPSKCYVKVCDLVCRWLNKTSGTCVDGRCKCDESTIAKNDMSDRVKFTSSSDCNLKACAQQCFRLGFFGGACVNGQCKCDYFLNTEAVPENSLSNLENSVSPRKCTHQECNAQCRKLLFREVVCIAGRCSCNNYFPIPKAAVSETQLPVSELSEDQTERACNMQACDQLCRRLKFPGGACVNGRFKCDNFFRTEVDAVDEYSESATRRICNLRQCNRTCTRRGYADARCVNGWCKYYNKIQRQEELIVPSPRACNTVNCNQMCHRLKYAGGWCRFGQCQCY